MSGVCLCQVCAVWSVFGEWCDNVYVLTVYVVVSVRYVGVCVGCVCM